MTAKKTNVLKPKTLKKRVSSVSLKSTKAKKAYPPKEVIPAIGYDPVLRFSGKAWLKIMHCRDCYSEEIAAYAISSKDDLLYIEDIWLPKQRVSWGSFEFDTDHTMEMMDHFFMDLGIEPYLCSRIWIHTHPHGVLGPSGTDEDTFSRVFRDFTWAIMVIFPKGCATPYAAMTINQSGLPTFRIQIPVEPDYSRSENVIDLDALKTTIQKNVVVESYVYSEAGEYSSRVDCYKGWDNDVSELHVNPLDSKSDICNDAPIRDDVSDEFPYIGDCYVCYDNDVPVNKIGVCALCTDETDSDEIGFDEFNSVCVNGICLRCGDSNIPVNLDGVCFDCSMACNIIEIGEVSL